MSYPARGPVSGIDGKASAASRRHEIVEHTGSFEEGAA